MSKIVTFLTMSFFLFSGSSFATKELVFFGDSLSDNGNLYKRVKVVPKSPPYYEGRFSNGPVWSEQVAQYFSDTYRISSQNFAIGGATVVKRRIIKGALPYDLKFEVTNYLEYLKDHDNKDTTYILFIGANDYLDEKRKAEDKLIKEVSDETVKQIKRLIDNGGKDFIILDVPDMAKAPYSLQKSSTYQLRMHNLSLKHHNKIIEIVKNLKEEYPKLRFTYEDIYTEYNQVISDIGFYNKKFDLKISNLTEPCWNGGYRLTELQAEPMDESIKLTIANSMSLEEAYNVGSSQSLVEQPCTNQDEHLFWDKIHPTYASHKIIAGIFIENLEDLLTD